jgi:ATP-dependent helicase/nuclease subunit A
MNLHRAKGLEAPVVFLANPLAGVEPRVDVRIVRDGARARGYLQLKRTKSAWGGETIGEPVGWPAHEAAELCYLRAEEKRLLYVAATRAREVLVIGRSAAGSRARTRPWQPFDAYLEHAPELVVPPAARPPAARAVDARPELRTADAAARAARHATACRPSWRLETVTDAAPPHPRAATAPDDTRAADRGRDWGTLVHALLEHAMRGPRRDRKHLGRVAAWLVSDKAELRDAVPHALDTVERVMDSAVWKRALAAEERLVEVPFAACRDEAGTPVVTQGVIDLVYRTTEGWELLDYKTDDPAGRLEALVETYRPQVSAYGAHWAALTGDRPVRVGIFFVRTGTVAWVEDVASGR